MHSATKYMNGHTDVVMGLVATNREDVHEQLRFLQNGERCAARCRTVGGGGENGKRKREIKKWGMDGELLEGHGNGGIL